MLSYTWKLNEDLMQTSRSFLCSKMILNCSRIVFRSSKKKLFLDKKIFFEKIFNLEKVAKFSSRHGFGAFFDFWVAPLAQERIKTFSKWFWRVKRPQITLQTLWFMRICVKIRFLAQQSRVCKKQLFFADSAAPKQLF